MTVRAGAIALSAAAVVAAGCGASKDRATVAGCPEGTPRYTLDDLMPKPPAGFEVVDADPKANMPVLDQLRKRLGKRVVRYDVKVVLRKSRTYGTLVVVANTDERFGGHEEILKGARSVQDDHDVEVRTIPTAGTQGVLVTGRSTPAYMAVPIGECAAAMLLDRRTERLLRTAAALRQP